ncbi:thioredoxin [Lausannevirus]|uniref:Thioredoxin n=1 Tax=Lausannevirus TaxID=999883 RepID=F2WLS0_9VIRU|nr:thioredoxin [Lausannevirus]AEA07193.1 thioredoxin [Lausannevirus]
MEEEGKLVFLEDELVPVEELGKGHLFDERFVKSLRDKDFDAYGNLKRKGCSWVVFYAPWCGHCKSLAPQWSKFAETAAFADVYTVNSDEEKKLLSRLNSVTPGFVEGFPTIVAYKDGESVQTYMGDRTSKALVREAMLLCHQ